MGLFRRGSKFLCVRAGAVVGVVAGLMAVGAARGAVLSGSVQTQIDDRIQVVDEHAGAIRVSRGYVLSCSGRDDRRATLHLAVGGRAAHWSVEAPVMYLRRHPRLRLPEHLRAGAVLFAAAGRNEASSSEEEATGSLVFDQVSCRNGPRVKLRVNARLGSEFFDGAAIRVTGSIRAFASTTR
jgi:hypothetical protein